MERDLKKYEFQLNMPRRNILDKFTEEIEWEINLPEHIQGNFIKLYDWLSTKEFNTTNNKRQRSFFWDQFELALHRSPGWFKIDDVKMKRY